MTKLKLLTWNIDSDYFNLQARIDSIVGTILYLDLDIVCLQEVRRESFDILVEKLSCYGNTGYLGGSFCNVIFFKNEPPKVNVKHLELTSNMNRTAVILEINGYIIATTHLESSGFMKSERKIQINEILEYLKTIVVDSDKFLNKNNSNSKIIICGDMNFRDDDETFNGYTSVTPSGTTCKGLYYLDKVYISSEIDINSVKTGLLGSDTFPSDHKGIYFVYEK
jgi:endonuclease/exonuclease/phosphatase family metal-dependent hydrolase